MIVTAQPITIADLGNIKDNKALPGELVVVIGSSNRGYDEWNPLTYEERETMVSMVLKDEGIIARIVGLPDYPNDNRTWASKLIEISGANNPKDVIVSTRSQWIENTCLYFGMQIYNHPEFCGGLTPQTVREMIRANNSAWEALVPGKAVEYLQSRISGTTTGVERIKAARSK